MVSLLTDQKSAVANLEYRQGIGTLWRVVLSVILQQELKSMVGVGAQYSSIPSIELDSSVG